MKKILSQCFILTLLLIGILNVYASTPPDSPNTTREINIEKKFTGLKSHAALEIIYTQNDLPSKALIQGPKDIIDGMTWKVDSNGDLSFQYPKNKKIKSGKIVIKLNGGPLYNYDVSSSGILKITTPVICNKTLNFVASSAGRIQFLKKVDTSESSLNIVTSSSGQIVFAVPVNGNTMNLTASSSGMVTVPSLSLNSLNYAGSSTGMLEVGNLKLKNASISLSSGGEANFKDIFSETISISASSGSEFKCKNITTNNMSLSVSSAGTISVGGKCITASMVASSGGTINSQNMKIERIKSQHVSSNGKIKL